jgi:hypothetical protein
MQKLNLSTVFHTLHILAVLLLITSSKTFYQHGFQIYVMLVY